MTLFYEVPVFVIPLNYVRGEGKEIVATQPRWKLCFGNGSVENSAHQGHSKRGMPKSGLRPPGRECFGIKA